MPRSSDALGCRRPGDHWFCRLGQPDGPVRSKWLCRPENFAALADLSSHWIDKVHQRRPPKRIVLDMDSSESPTYGEQEGSAYNGHFGCTCYHPLFVFNQFGDVERCALRPGNVHSAAGWRDRRPVARHPRTRAGGRCREFAILGKLRCHLRWRFGTRARQLNEDCGLPLACGDIRRSAAEETMVCGLSAGGSWIRTCGSAPDRQRF
jgi:hypothetical protein